jgi:cell wall-associated NlpC family hydrolase
MSTASHTTTPRLRRLGALLATSLVTSFCFAGLPAAKAEAATVQSSAAIVLAKKKAKAATERHRIIATAKKYRGIRYVFGGASPRTGFDCSGFTKYTFGKSVHMTLPHSANAQSRLGRRVSAAKAKPGDLVVYSYPGNRNFHVAILLNKKQVIHAKKPGTVTQVGNLHWGGTSVQYIDVVDPHVGL